MVPYYIAYLYDNYKANNQTTADRLEQYGNWSNAKASLKTQAGKFQSLKNKSFVDISGDNDLIMSELYNLFGADGATGIDNLQLHKDSVFDLKGEKSFSNLKSFSELDNKMREQLEEFKSHYNNYRNFYDVAVKYLDMASEYIASENKNFELNVLAKKDQRQKLSKMDSVVWEDFKKTHNITFGTVKGEKKVDIGAIKGNKLVSGYQLLVDAFNTLPYYTKDFNTNFSKKDKLEISQMLSTAFGYYVFADVAELVVGKGLMNSRDTLFRELQDQLKISIKRDAEKRVSVSLGKATSQLVDAYKAAGGKGGAQLQSKVQQKADNTLVFKDNGDSVLASIGFSVKQYKKKSLTSKSGSFGVMNTSFVRLLDVAMTSGAGLGDRTKAWRGILNVYLGKEFKPKNKTDKQALTKEALYLPHTKEAQLNAEWTNIKNRAIADSALYALTGAKVNNKTFSQDTAQYLIVNGEVLSIGSILEHFADSSSFKNAGIKISPDLKNAKPQSYSDYVWGVNSSGTRSSQPSMVKGTERSNDLLIRGMSEFNKSVTVRIQYSAIKNSLYK